MKSMISHLICPMPESGSKFHPIEMERTIGSEADFDQDIFAADTALDTAFTEILELGRSLAEAERILLEYAEREPKIAALLDCPQSPDKHAEGPFILDHYRTILIALETIKKGLLESSKLPACVDMKGYERDWDAATTFIKENPDLMLVFALAHDLGKDDYVGFYSKTDAGVEAGFPTKREFHSNYKNLTPADREKWKEKYRGLYEEFVAQNGGTLDADMQQKFFDTYGISVTYIDHEKGLSIPVNRAVADRLIAEKGLDENEARLLDYSVLFHVTHYMGFANGPADFEAMLLAADEAGLDRTTAIRSLQAGMMIDGMLGARKRQEGSPDFFIATDTMRKFFDAERAYPAYAEAQEVKKKEQEKRGKIKKILLENKLGGKDLVELKIAPTTRAIIVEAIYTAVGGSGTLELDDEVRARLPDKAFDILQARVRAAHESFQKE